MNRRELLKSIVATVAITTGLAITKLETITKHFLDTAYPVGHAFRYGADPTGFMDSSPAASRAIEDAQKVGATVHFPPGEYRFSQTLVVPEGVHIEINHSKIVLEAAQPLDFQRGWSGAITYNHFYMPEFTRIYQQGKAPANLWGLV